MGTRGYFLLDGISNMEKGMVLESAVPFILPKRSRNRETIPGRLSSLESQDWAYQPTGVKLGLAVQGADKAEVVQKLQAASPWLLGCTELRLWYAPDKYYLGAVEGELEFSMITRTYGRLSLEFLCNPPCWHKARSKLAGWEPLPGVPIPEQITSSTETASATIAGSGALPSVAYAAAFPAALYFAVTGTWDTLNLGGATGLILSWPTPQPMTVYADCEAQQVYHKMGGVMTSLMGYCSGDFPVLKDTSAISVTGQNLNAAVRLFVIERG